MTSRLNGSGEQQDLLDRLCSYLKDHFSCETAILYGSRARGDWDHASDIDVLAFGSAGETPHVAHRWEDLFLDLFLYPSRTNPTSDWLRIHDGLVLFQNATDGDDALAATKAMFLAGPEQMSETDRQTTRLWLDKMLSRAEKGDPEGNYRRHWLLKEMLEIYFNLRGEWYMGPKKAIATLRIERPAHFDLFRRAFAPGAGMTEMCAAIEVVKGSD